MKNVVLACALILTSLAANANSLNDVVADISKNPGKYSLVEVPQTSFSAKQWTQLSALAEKESWIWGDTILEGDYISSNEPVVLDLVEAVYSGKSLVAYKIVYSAKAWDTGACEVDYDALEDENANLDEVLAECTVGKIVGNSYVNVTLTEAERDWDNGESFEE
ncbi:hypothetical protein [Bdellovibrio reynosensis]|uniref:Uncharacterized protein n=1 Tax=Bdellovibrio reynosensis TaxID=2835041 RepID=A0ABY4CC72_9BACT|nr:hypothetical protein [Bdellovibrio reynosensis]UOF02374.1 hypothetical protein MNR06_05345 [Bdellovibrio reynosensis]